MGIDAVLDRFKGVRKIGPGRWKAHCSAHRDRTPSLAIRELDDGRILIHCHAQCEVSAVLAGAGLSMEDLFPERLETEGRPVRRPWPASDLLHMLDFESLVVLVAACDAISKGKLSPSDLDRVARARERIAGVMSCLPKR